MSSCHYASAGFQVLEKTGIRFSHAFPPVDLQAAARSQRGDGSGHGDPVVPSGINDRGMKTAALEFKTVIPDGDPGARLGKLLQEGGSPVAFLMLEPVRAENSRPARAMTGQGR
jgi:hypothetical protein